MLFTIITAFPDFFRDFLVTSIVGRAIKSGLFQVETVDLHSFGRGAYRQIDDYAFGAGGMVLMAPPLSEALDAAISANTMESVKPFVVYPTPQGVPLTQEIVETLSRQHHVVIVCGHYEGLDERFVEQKVDLEVTIGDCVLTGGEIPAMTIIDAVSRLIPGVVGKGEAVEKDSFFRGMLDHPHYTRPALWKGKSVPEVLLSGNAAEIDEWRRKQAVSRTLSRRPDLLSRCSLLGYMGGGFYLALTAEQESEYGTDGKLLEEWGRLCGVYGVSRLFLVVRDTEERECLRRIISKFDTSVSAKIKLMPSLNRVFDWIGEKEGRPFSIEVPDELRDGTYHWLETKRLVLEKDGPVLFYFSHANETTEQSFDACLSPLQKDRLPFYGKMTALLDRFLGAK